MIHLNETCVQKLYYVRVPPAQLIGQHIGTDSHANNSFLSTGFAHAGIVGITIYSILVGLMFRLLDSVAVKGVPPWVAVAAVIVPSQALLVGADLPAAILTHGIGVSAVLLFLLRSPRGLEVRESPVDQGGAPSGLLQSAGT